MQTSQRNELAQSMMPLVRHAAASVARRVPPHIQLDDLIGAGMLGLAKALDRYDDNRCQTFRAYAEYRIRGAIMDELRRCDVLTRECRIESKKVQRMATRLSSKLGRAANSNEIAACLGVSIETYQEMQTRYKGTRVVSTDKVDLPDHSSNPFDETSQDEVRARLAESLASLPRRHALILWLCYHEEMPLRKIAKVLDVTPSRVCQLRKEAICKVRRTLEPQAEALL